MNIHHIKLASHTSLVNITADDIAEQASSPPIGTVRITLRGTLQEIKVAKTLIGERAEKSAASVALNIVERSGQDSHLEISMRYNMDEDGPVRLLSLVHKATQCDLGARINENLRYGSAPEPADSENEQTHHSLVAITIGHPANTDLSAIITRYLLEALNQLAQTDAFQTDCVSLLPDENKILLMTREPIGDKNAAKLRAAGLAEHISGLLGLHDKSPGL